MKRILIVDDDAVTVSLIQFQIGSECEVATAGSVSEALDRLLDFSPDVAILDYVLPDGTAAKILEFVKSARLKCKCIVITKFTNLKVIRETRALGAFDFLQKPVSPVLLKETIEIAFGYPDQRPEDEEPKLNNAISLAEIPVLDIAKFKEVSNVNKKILLQVLELVKVEIKANVQNLNQLIGPGEDKVASKKTLMFWLHRLEGVAASIYALKLERVCLDIQASAERNETCTRADLDYLTVAANETIDEVIKAETAANREGVGPEPF